MTSYVQPRDTVGTLQLSSSAMNGDRDAYSDVYAGTQCLTRAAVANNSGVNSDDELLSEESLEEAQDNISRVLEQYRLELAELDARAEWIRGNSPEDQHFHGAEGSTADVHKDQTQRSKNCLSKRNGRLKAKHS